MPWTFAVLFFGEFEAQRAVERKQPFHLVRFQNKQ
jgi:hypothetical protein